ncbi:hypothetical protein [Spiroplasma diminutum]|uniref:Uncharacterized protein n=1 Tax=Spiroplasma diminutum CUAS-1 TaxID=1276221 RepID=S5M227_9MOLU|nr:hypothetical protein [Spiroplasma diminutum]AGR42127.1 hypothetical protein SDIMI_v3c04230 [Spiroplasma diminutum CUAS-1]
MKSLLSILGVSTLIVTPIPALFNTNRTELNMKENILVNNNLETNKVESIEDNINLNLETWAVGKTWGSGGHTVNYKDVEDEIEINLDKFGGKYLLQHNYEDITVTIIGEYFFQKGKKFNWNNYEKDKSIYSASRTFTWDLREGLGNWIELKHVKSNKGGYEWGNYYKAYAYANFKDNNTLVIKLKYRISAYGVGANWYWSAGSLKATKIRYNARKY